MNIVYYLGAGASANAIPTINGMRERLFDLTSFLSKYLKDNLNEAAFSALSIELQNSQLILQEIINELEWLFNETVNHQTVDTFAKKLFLQESNDLKKMKRALITYFYFEQSLPFNAVAKNINGFKGYENMCDLRYDSLFANIIHRKNGKLIIDDNINIITWNYDLQIELALKNYFNISINKIKSDLRIHPNKNSYDLPTGEIVIPNNFQVIKLNGNAFLDYSLQNSTDLTAYDRSWNEENKEVIISNYLIELENEFTKDLKLTDSAAFKYFSFAWESNENFGSSYIGKKNVIDSARKIISGADVLIVIGYSFPYFNFEIDKMLFEEITLQQLIIQDENPDSIKERMNPILKQLNQPNHKDNPPLKYTSFNISPYFPIYKY